MRVAHINVISELSTGRIALGICESLMRNGHAALLCYARGPIPHKVPGYRIGSRLDTLVHAGLARFFDCAGFLSRRATKRLVRQLQLYKPDIVHLHNLHGYYLNLPILMAYLAEADIPVVWTLHDCWAFTGHCAHYARAGCDRFRTGCHHCPNLRQYPKSLLLDRSKQNWLAKRAAIRAVKDITLIVPSQWMAGEVRRSFLADYPLHVIPSGIDLDQFRPADEDSVRAVLLHYGLREEEEMETAASVDEAASAQEAQQIKAKKKEEEPDKPIILSVASAWCAAKGINDLMDLQELLGDEMVIAVAGLTEKQAQYLPPPMVAIQRISSMHGLRSLYTAADLYISLSYEESQGLTLIEAMACGTQVICYNSTALPELVTEDTGMVVPAGDVGAAAEACRALVREPKLPDDCQARAFAFDRDRQSAEYVKLYEGLVGFQA